MALAPAAGTLPARGRGTTGRPSPGLEEEGAAGGGGSKEATCKAEASTQEGRAQVGSGDDFLWQVPTGCRWL